MKTTMLCGLLVSTFGACGDASDSSDEVLSITIAPDAGQGESPDASATDSEDMPAEQGEVREPPQFDGECPSFDEGSHDFVSGGVTRSFRVELPPEPEGAPVVFAWHWLGGNANTLINTLGLARLANEKGAIVIAPESDGSSLEWHFTEGPQNNPDLQLFEGLLACAHERHSVDLDRIYSTGHSAGGLWTSYLTIHASQWLAATAIMSGGADARTYQTPERKLPVLVIWGGPTDTYGGFRFEDSSRYLTEELQKDGHFVANCEHSTGHLPPVGGMEYIWAWFQDHPYGAEEPYLDGLPDVFPDYCRIP